jgi:hypothetical protein
LKQNPKVEDDTSDSDVTDDEIDQMDKDLSKMLDA